MKTINLINYLFKRFPRSIANKWGDNVGLMTGKVKPEVNKILVCLDLDEEIYDKIIRFQPDMIITHHPFIYKKSKYQVFKKDKKKEAFCKKIDELGITVYSFHTNFDEGKGGMNDALASELDLHDIYQPESMPMMRIGDLSKSMSREDFAKYAKEKLGVGYGLLIPCGNTKVKKVGIIGGGGSGFWNIAQAEGCDIYISGDAPHHVRRSIVTSKFNYLDLPHEIEKIFVPTMTKIIHEYCNDVKILSVDHEKLPKVIL